jgi:CBS domain containing-hemolysin-like protein
LIEKELGDDTYIFRLDLTVEYLNQTYKLNIPESDSYGTLGGFIVDFTNDIPLKGEKIAIGTYHFIIEEATNKKIELVKLTVKE